MPSGHCREAAAAGNAKASVEPKNSRRVIHSEYTDDLSIQLRDRALIQIVDSAMAEAARKSGPWLLCRPGCTQCCIGPFAISQLDAERLRRGLAELQVRDAGRAERVRERARQSAERFTAVFPSDPVTGLLAGFGEDEPCPVLDPDTGTC